MQVISVRTLPRDLSSFRLTAPGIAIQGRGDEHGIKTKERYNKRTIEECGPPTAAVKLGGARVKWSTTASARVDTLFAVLVVLPGVREFCTFLTEDAELRVQKMSVQDECMVCSTRSAVYTCSGESMAFHSLSDLEELMLIGVVE